MKLLISAGYFPSKPYADNNIELNIAEELQRLGHECDICGITYDEEPACIDLHGVRVYKIPYAEKILLEAMHEIRNFNPSGGKIPHKVMLQFACRHPRMAYTLYQYGRKKERSGLVTSYSMAVSELINTNKYDVVISAVWPFEKTEELIDSRLIQIPFIYYQLDPYGLSQYKELSGKNTSIQREVQTMQKCGAVITTEELAEEYHRQKAYQPILPVMHSLKFPSYVTFDEENLESPVSFEKNKINIVYTGSVDDETRDPLYALQLFEAIIKEGMNLSLWFIGRFESEDGKQFMQAHDCTWLHLHEAVSYQESIAVLQSADFLLNLSNSYTNMIPSKIFTYFASGKPILNFQQIHDDPSEPYFSRYPLACTVKQYEAGNQVDKVLRFIKENKEKSVPEKIRNSIYYENTPAYSAARISEIVANTIKNNESAVQ